jgi:hypothetical protein
MPVHHRKLIRDIGPDERVLEIGPGGFPFPRADVLCDRYSRRDAEAYGQDGNVTRPAYAQPLILYSGARTPFIDRSFDYVICSHVLEHVPAAEIHEFVAELTRIGRSGYLEFPSYALEMLSNVEAHRWLVNVVAGEIRLLEKSAVGSLVEQVARIIGPIFERLSESSPTYQKLYQGYLPVWIVGLEWEEEINYRVVDSLEELLDAGDRANLIERLAAAERRQTEMMKLTRRLPRAVRDRIERLIKRKPARAQQSAQRAGLPDWLASVIACPACKRAGVCFDSSGARCESCGARYAERDGEYVFYSSSAGPQSLRSRSA